MLPDPLAHLRAGVWTLDELVELANGLLPDYLPKETSGRAAEVVNQRLVRHYTTLGLLPETRRDGREVRYLFGHLLRLLVLRRLLADGFSSQAIKRMFEGATDQDLEGVLSGGVNVELVPERDPASTEARTAFVQRLRGSAGLAPLPDEGLITLADASPVAKVHAPPQRSAKPGRRKEESASAEASVPAPPPAAPTQAAEWSRIELEEGLELHVRDDYRFPIHRQGDEELSQRIKLHLLQLEQRRKQRS